MDKVAIDKLVRICLYECLCTTRLPSELTHAIREITHPPIRDLITLFIEKVEEKHAKVRGKTILGKVIKI